MAWVKVAKVKDVPPEGNTSVEVNGKTVGLFNVGGTLYAMDGICPHRGGPLGEGVMDGPVVTCNWHGWQFDVKSGKSLVTEDTLSTYPVKAQGDDILVDI